METLVTLLGALSTLCWLGFALLPWHPWSTQEALDATGIDGADDDLSQITVLIPARNEAEVIQRTLQSVIAQGQVREIVLVDDNSEDTTIEKARQLATTYLRIVPSLPLPPGWSGKLWALEQGRRWIMTPYTLLLDADIELAAGVIRDLREKMHYQGVTFISLMAAPSMLTGWEKLLMPAFVHFFKILYPFRRVNSPHTQIAAAAGGCVLMESRLLEQLGGFQSVKSAVIDDCALAARVKMQGERIWLGLTHSATSVRGYSCLSEIWDMVARSAFAQLHHSVARLILCTVLIVQAFWVPLIIIAYPNVLTVSLFMAALTIMVLTYFPTLRFYARSWAWALGMPLIAGLFLAMTWTSAIRYWRGEQTRWKARVYRRA